MITPKIAAAKKEYFRLKRKEAVREWWSIGDGTVHIPLNEELGLEAIIDEDDVSKASHFKWCAAKHYKKFYVEAGVSEELHHLHGRHTTLHRVIVDATKGDPHVDHGNGDTLDCRKQNLRFATRSQNSSNWHRPNKTGYRGVISYGNRWAAQISVEGKHRHLGYYDTPVLAAQAYNEAALKAFGEFSILNKF